jgi:excisionase family DNA binding protein
MKTATASKQESVRGALKLKPAAHYLSVSEITVRRLVERGLLKPNRATRHLLFPLTELDRFLSQ